MKKPFETNDDYSVRNGLIVNVNMNWIFNTLITADQRVQADDSIIMLLDPSGKVLGHSESKYFLEDLSDEEYVRHLMSKSEKSGYCIDDVNGQKSVVVFSSIDELQWKLVSITPYANIAKSVDQVKYIISLISMLVLLLGLLLVYLLSRNLYTPIGMLRTNIEHMIGKTGEQQEAMSEFKYIESNVFENSQALKILESFKGRNINRLKQELFQNILFGTTRVNKKLEDTFKDLNVQIRSTGTFLSSCLKSIIITNLTRGIPTKKDPY